MKTITLKTILFAILTLSLQVINPSFGQEEKQDKPDKEEKQEIEVLFSNDVTHGGYGGIYFGYTQVADRNAFVSGVKGAWIINHSIGLGFAGTGFFSELKPGIIPNEEWSAITGGYGGLLIEPILFGTKPIHVSIPILIGGGGIVYGNDQDYYYGHHPGYDHDYSGFFDYFFVFEPGIELEFSLTKFFRLATGVSYRITSDIDITRTVNDIDYQVIKPNDLQNFTVHLAFKFGKF